ncbi:unnamed protein product, partial [Tenebrio molitor]
QGEPASPQPSVDRFSVTFAEDSVKSDSSTKCNYYSPATFKMDKVHFPEGSDIENSDEEDYSASVNAVIIRRASTKKGRRRSTRRASSPFSPDILLGSDGGRRRSSVFTTSSGDTAITIDDNAADVITQDEIFENIKIHKEVLRDVKMQPWNMRKKLKLVIQAKTYIKKHEGALQERLAQSRSTRDMLARWNIYLIKKWQHYRRELANLSNWLVPWELKIKEIESHFGSVVASYFTFLRWLFWVNIVLGVVLISFVAVPEMLTAAPDDRKRILPEEKYNSTNFQTLWDFEGVLRYSPLFYGWYTYKEKGGYRMPFAYFITGLVAYAYSFFATLRKMAENSRMSKLSEKDDECIFSWKLFTAWDYMIGNAETAHNRIASIVVGFKEALVEEAEKKREARNWKITAFRILVNTIVLGLLFFSAFAVVLVVQRSKEPEARSSVWRRNEITFVMTLISLSFPMIFEGLGFLEQYHPRKQLRLQLARIMVLNLLNLYSLIFALFDKIDGMTSELEKWKNNLTTANTSLQAYSAVMQSNLIAALATNVSFTMYPIMQKALKNATAETDKEITDSEFTTRAFSAISTGSSDALNYTTSLPGVGLETSASYNDSGAEFEEFESSFVDYLASVLLGFAPNQSDTPEGDLSVFANSSTVSYDYVKSTLAPILNITESETEKISTVVQALSSTLESFGKNVTKKKNCKTICKSVTLPFDNTSVAPPKLIDESRFNYSTKWKLRSLCWETMFGHGLVILNIIKLLILMYFRTWIVLTCNVPHEIIFRASRSNNFYYALLLMMLFLCVLPVGYTIVRIKPSWHCGPFSKYDKIFHIFTKTIKQNVPKPVNQALDYIASPGIVIPLLLLLVLIIYYLISLTGALREANEDLKLQLVRERTEERRKMFQIADRRRRGPGGSGEFFQTPFTKWKRLMGSIPNAGKSFDDTSPRQESSECPKIKEEEPEAPKARDFFSKFIKKALGKSSTSEEENHDNQNMDEGTDTEQHESLPEDLVSVKDSKLQSRFDFPRAILSKKNSQKSTSESSDKNARPVPAKKEMRQDSGSSVWSDNIPVITISKTESAECLDVVPEVAKAEPVSELPKFKPKIKCVLKKQSAEIDEDVIRHFSKDLDLKPGLEEHLEKDVGAISESSDDTARESSTDTVLAVKVEDKEEEAKTGANGVELSSSTTESSTEYNDNMSL